MASASPNEPFIPTTEEIKSLERAFKDENFRRLLVEYAQEIQDPENRRKYEEDIAKMEAQQGNDVKFINPTPGFVVKTCLQKDGSKVFVNICESSVVGEPQKSKAVRNGKDGTQWSVPHSVTPHREDLDKSGNPCIVYDVVFHPQAIRLSRTHVAFRDMIVTTALDGIEQRFPQHILVRDQLKFPKMKFKGVAQRSMIRERRPDASKAQSPPDANNDTAIASMMKSFNEIHATTTQQHQQQEEHAASPRVIVPEYSVVHRNEFDMQQYRDAPDATRTSQRPDVLVVSVVLPLCTSAAGLDLDITAEQLTLHADSPGPYHLEVPLPFPVNADGDSSTAKFDKSRRTLIVTLSVVRPEPNEVSPTHPPPVLTSAADDTPQANDSAENGNSDTQPDTQPDNDENDTEDNDDNGARTQDAEDKQASTVSDAAHAALETLTYHQTDDTISLQMRVGATIGEGSLAFESTVFGPITTHTCVCRFGNTFSLSFGFDIALDTDACRVDVRDGVAVVLLKKALRTPIQRMRAGVTGGGLAEKRFLTSENVDNARRESSKMWTSRDQASVAVASHDADHVAYTITNPSTRADTSNDASHSTTATTSSKPTMPMPGLKKMFQSTTPTVVEPKVVEIDIDDDHDASAAANANGGADSVGDEDGNDIVYDALGSERLKLYKKATEGMAEVDAPRPAPSQPESSRGAVLSNTFIDELE